MRGYSKISDEELLAEQENDDLRRALDNARRDLAKAKRGQDALREAVYQAARDAAVSVGKVKAPQRDRRKGKAEVALWHLTDWQGGKKTASYNLDVMDERVIRFSEKAASITDIARADHPVRECVIALGGDMVEGVTIFPGQAWQVDSTLFTQVFRVAARLEATLRFALSVYEKVHVVAEPGNHGRIGGKKDGVPAGDNMDRIVYEIVKQTLASENRLTWVGVDHFYQQIIIGEYRAMLIHGDEIKGFGGNTPAYGIVRKCNAWASGAVPFQFNDVYIGHYHNPNTYCLANGGRVFMSGSTESDNVFAAEFVAATSIPSQRLHFIDPDK